jgi:hypothetical protein
MPVARTTTSAEPKPVVREGGLRVVVAANSFARPRLRSASGFPSPLARKPRTG